MAAGLLRRWLCGLLLVSTMLPSTVAAARPTAGKAASMPAGARAPAPGAAEDVSLDITVEASRANPVVGSDLGITAVFKNTSKRTTVYLAESTTTLTLPPELEGPAAKVQSREAYFPSENDQRKAARDAAAGQPFPPKEVLAAIPPGHSYRAIWVQAMPSAPTAADEGEPAKWASPAEEAVAQVAMTAFRQILMELRYLFFAPGEYKILVQAKVWTNEPPSKTGYYTFSQVATIKAAAPQFVIIFGAMIGGIACWLLYPQQEQPPRAHGLRAQIWWRISRLSAAVGVLLYAAIFTILMARLSDTQFLVKINVTDFWGAVVVGFIAQYLGKAALDKYLPGRNDERKGGGIGDDPAKSAPGQTRASLKRSSDEPPAPRYPEASDTVTATAKPSGGKPGLLKRAKAYFTALAKGGSQRRSA